MAFTDLTNRIENNVRRTAEVNSILYNVQEKLGTREIDNGFRTKMRIPLPEEFLSKIITLLLKDHFSPC